MEKEATNSAFTFHTEKFEEPQFALAKARKNVQLFCT